MHGEAGQGQAGRGAVQPGPGEEVSVAGGPLRASLADTARRWRSRIGLTG